MSQPLALQLLHDTRYDYDAAVAISQHLAWLQPLSNQRQLLEQFALEIEPAPPSLSLERDHFGNLRHREPHASFVRVFRLRNRPKHPPSSARRHPRP